MRYFFHLRGPGGPILDSEGVEAVDPEMAHSEALEAVAAILQEEASLATLWRGWSLEIVDSADVVVATIELTRH